MSDSVHDKLARKKKPRVHLSYNVENEGSEKRQELPLVGAVLSNLTGNNPKQELKPLKERRFIEVDKDNVDLVMEKLKPGLAYSVPNVFDPSGQAELRVDLAFEAMDDFSPEEVVKQVAPLRNLLEIRNQLNDLLGKADRSEALEQLLESLMQNGDELHALLGESHEKNN
jgi:type VI secretion system protein ImpB